jgi:pSer/pThr/pTyr-binding forkhead associated (FHA) protein
MNPKLIEPGDETRGAREIPLKGEEFLLGRGSDCDLRLSDSDVSRHHCLIRLRGDEAILVDLGSSNGTFLNGRRVRSQAAMQTGDEIRIVNHRFLIDLGGPGGSPDTRDSDATARTYKRRRATPEEREEIDKPPTGLSKKESHPPGEAGGRGILG